MQNEYWSLISVGLGSLITILGLSINNYYTRRHENKVLSRNKLEEIYSLTQLIKVTMHNQVQEPNKVVKNEFDKSIYNLDRISMLINLYHPWLKNDFKKLKEDAEYFNHIVPGLASENYDPEEYKGMEDIIDNYKIAKKSVGDFLTKIELNYG